MEDDYADVRETVILMESNIFEDFNNITLLLYYFAEDDYHMTR